MSGASPIATDSARKPRHGPSSSITLPKPSGGGTCASSDPKRRNGDFEASARYHAFYWWHRGDPALSTPARVAIANGQNEKFVSAITAWEFITKFRSGKQPEFAGIAADVAMAVASHGFGDLPITRRHAQAASNLPLHHRDPMERFIIGQALVEDMTIVTVDHVFANYGTKTLW